MMCNMLFCIMYIDHEFAIYKMCTQHDNYFYVYNSLSVIIISFMFTRESLYTIIHQVQFIRSPMQVRMYVYVYSKNRPSFNICSTLPPTWVVL